MLNLASSIQAKHLTRVIGLHVNALYDVAKCLSVVSTAELSPCHTDSPNVLVFCDGSALRNSVGITRNGTFKCEV